MWLVIWKQHFIYRFYKWTTCNKQVTVLLLLFCKCLWPNFVLCRVGPPGHMVCLGYVALDKVVCHIRELLITYFLVILFFQEGGFTWCHTISHDPEKILFLIDVSSPRLPKSVCFIIGMLYVRKYGKRDASILVWVSVNLTANWLFTTQVSRHGHKATCCTRKES